MNKEEIKILLEAYLKYSAKINNLLYLLVESYLNNIKSLFELEEFRYEIKQIYLNEVNNFKIEINIIYKINNEFTSRDYILSFTKNDLINGDISKIMLNKLFN